MVDDVTNDNAANSSNEDGAGVVYNQNNIDSQTFAEAVNATDGGIEERTNDEHEDIAEQMVLGEDEEDATSQLKDIGATDILDENNWVSQVMNAAAELFTEDTNREQDAVEDFQQRARAVQEESNRIGEASRVEGHASEAAEDVQMDILQITADANELDSITNDISTTAADNTYDNFIAIEEADVSADEAANGLDHLGAGLGGPGILGMSDGFSGVEDNFIDAKEVGVRWEAFESLMEVSSDWMQNPKAIMQVMQTLQDLGIGGKALAFHIMSELLSSESETHMNADGDYTYETFYYADGTIVFEDSSGWSSVMYPDGSTESKGEDGSWSRYDMETGIWESYDPKLGVIFKTGLSENGEYYDLVFKANSNGEYGSQLLNDDGSPMTNAQYWEAYGEAALMAEDEYVDSSYTEASYSDESAYSAESYADDTAVEAAESASLAYQTEDGNWRTDYDDGSYSIYNDDYSAGSYYDANTGWLSEWSWNAETGDSFYALTNPDGVQYVDNGLGDFTTADGQVFSYDDVYSDMNADYDAAYVTPTTWTVSTGDTMLSADSFSSGVDQLVLSVDFLDLNGMMNNDSINQDALSDLLSGGGYSLEDLGQLADGLVVNSVDSVTEDTRFILQEDGTLLYDEDGSGDEAAEAIFQVSEGDIHSSDVTFSSNHTDSLGLS